MLHADNFMHADGAEHGIEDYGTERPVSCCLQNNPISACDCRHILQCHKWTRKHSLYDDTCGDKQYILQNSLGQQPPKHSVCPRHCSHVCLPSHSSASAYVLQCSISMTKRSTAPCKRLARFAENMLRMCNALLHKCNCICGMSVTLYVPAFLKSLAHQVF